MARKKHKSEERLGPFTKQRRNRWRDPKYQEIPWDEKAMLSQVEGSDSISAAGVLRADPEILAQQHPDQDAAHIEDFLKRLEDRGRIRRSGMEIFVTSWFIEQPIQLRTRNSVNAMATAIGRIGYADLRVVVAEELFRSLLEIAEVDGLPTAESIKKECTALATSYGIHLPAELRDGKSNS